MLMMTMREIFESTPKKTHRIITGIRTAASKQTFVFERSPLRAVFSTKFRECVHFHHHHQHLVTERQTTR